MRNTENGFTLFEMLAVMVILGLVIAVVPTPFKGNSPMAQAKSEAATISARLRGLRAKAIAMSDERLAIVDLDKKSIRFDDGRGPVMIDRSLTVAVTSADSERVSPVARGIRFYPNGASSGATIRIASGNQGFLVRINWLTGRVSTDAL